MSWCSYSSHLRELIFFSEIAGIFDEIAAYDDGKILCHCYITRFRANCYRSVVFVDSFDKLELIIILAFFLRTIV